MRNMTLSRVAALSLFALAFLAGIVTPIEAAPAATVGIITRFAGGGTGPIIDGGSADAGVMYGGSVILDSAGNVYESEGSAIWRINAGLHTTTLIAGTGVWGFSGDGGPATTARLNGAWGMGLDSAGNLYFADNGNYRVRKVSASTGIITTIAGTGTPGYSGEGVPATSAQFNAPRELVVDASGNVYFRIELGGILVIDAQTQTIRWLPGGGSGSGIALDGAGNLISADGRRINRISLTTGQVTRIAGLEYGLPGGVLDPMIATDVATDAYLQQTSSVAVDSHGDVYFSDTYGVHKLAVATGRLTMIAGSGYGNEYQGSAGVGGLATAAMLPQIYGLAVDAAGTVYIGSSEGFLKVDTQVPSPVMSTVAGTGQSQGGPNDLATPEAIVVDANGNLFIADTGDYRIKKLSSAGVLSIYAGTGIPGFSGDGSNALTARLNSPMGMAVDAAGNLFVADRDNNRIRKIATNGIITTVAGTATAGFSGDGGPATSAELNKPSWVALDPANGNLYIADTTNYRVRKVDAVTGVITTIAGTGTKAGGATPDAPVLATAGDLWPTSLAIDASSNLFILSYKRIRRVDAVTGVMSNYAGTGNGYYEGYEGALATQSMFNNSYSLCIDGSGNVLVADLIIRRIRQIDAATGIVHTVAGNGSLFLLGGDGWPSTVAPIVGPTSCAVDAQGGLYIADDRTHYIRKSTMSTVPGAFNKRGPTNGATGQATSPTLTWSASSDATRYEYCIDTTNDNACSNWVNTGNATSVVLSGLNAATWYYWQVRAIDDAGITVYADESSSAFSSFTSAQIRHFRADFDGDRKTDLTVYRPSTGRWYVLNSATGMQTYDVYGWGLPGDQPEQGDFDGDGTPDLAVYRPATGEWWILWSSTKFQTYNVFGWGLAGDVPVPADYDGDGKTDIAIYRPSDGGWWILQSSTDFATYSVYNWGQVGDVPVVGDYDGDGKADPAVYRPTTGSWRVLRSSTNHASSSVYGWGLDGDVPVPADYDSDGKIDIAIYRPSDGGWWILWSSTNYQTYSTFGWGLAGDVPVPADYDGDGKTDIAIYRPTTAEWWILKSSSNFATFSTYGWGLGGDLPIPQRP